MGLGDEIFQVFVVVFVVAFSLGFLIAVSSDRDVCRARGGVLVEGVFWYECVATPNGEPAP